MVALTRHWTKLNPHNGQSALWRTKARMVGVYAGRGSGKTELARRRIVRMLPLRKPWSDPLYLWGMPTYRQAKRVAWNKLLDLIPKDWISDISLSDMRIDTKFGSSLLVMGMDSPERAEGVQYDGIVLDESSDIKPGVFTRSLMPAMTHRNAWCWRIGVPKRFGAGALEFREFCEQGEIGQNAIQTFSWPSSTVLTAEQLAQAKAQNDQKDFEEQFEAKWANAGGSIFHAFDLKVHVRSDLQYCPELPLIVSSDFNVDPMCWIVAHIHNGILYVIDELFVRNTNTPATLDILYKRYGHHQAGFEFYGDASARAKHSSTSTTDYAHIVNDNRFENKKVYYLKSNPRQVDRFASCNALLTNANGDIRCYIHSRCKWLIRDLRMRSYKEMTREPDDRGDIGHITDAFGYVVYRRFPLKLRLTSQIPQASYGAAL